MLIAGRLTLNDVMHQLARARPVFHSEADLQHAFARVLWTLAPEVEARLEVRQDVCERIERLDLLCAGPSTRTAVEFKYVTRRWVGTAGAAGERYALKNHAADDLARLGFVSDIERLERFCTDTQQNGLALLVTNMPSLWSPPTRPSRPTRDREFRLHDGRSLAGRLEWGGGDFPANTRSLRGAYALSWRPYARPDGEEFRYLAVEVAGGDSR
jgi:hypothetical protein